MYYGKDEHIYNALEKLGFFARFESIEGKRHSDLVQSILENLSGLDEAQRFEYILDILLKYGVIIKYNDSTTVQDFLSDVSNSIYSSGFHPGKYTVSFLRKRFGTSRKSVGISQFRKINTLLLRNRGLKLKRIKYIRDGSRYFCLVNHGIRFDRFERRFLRI